MLPCNTFLSPICKFGCCPSLIITVFLILQMPVVNCFWRIGHRRSSFNIIYMCKYSICRNNFFQLSSLSWLNIFSSNSHNMLEVFRMVCTSLGLDIVLFTVAWLCPLYSHYEFNYRSYLTSLPNFRFHLCLYQKNSVKQLRNKNFTYL